MKKLGFILFLVTLFAGVTGYCANIQFKTNNLNTDADYLNISPKAYKFYQKNKNILQNNNDSSSTIINQKPETVKLEDIEIKNYNIYSPDEYKSVDFNKEAILFIIDFSASMLDEVVGQQKTYMATNTMRQLLPQLSPKTQLGLRLYGHKISFTPIDACKASELVVPIGTNNAHKIYSALTQANARGNTPISYSLKQAINKDFANFKGKKRIILLTDGGENCDESPCSYASSVLAQRDDISIDVIAFDINNKEADAQLKCTALVTKGKFYKANNEKDLIDSLTNSLNIQKDVQGVILK